MSQATVSRARPLERRWKSSNTKAVRRWSAISLTSCGSIRSTMRAAPMSSGEAIGPGLGQARRNDSSTFDQRTTRSLSASTRLSHAAGLRLASSP